MKAVIDRFEGELAVLTPPAGGKPISLPKAVLPQDAAAGDTVELVKGKWTIDRDDTEERRKRITEKARMLFKE
jgi:hypothetical protein